jgi:hypothetical protein
MTHRGRCSSLSFPRIRAPDVLQGHERDARLVENAHARPSQNVTGDSSRQARFPRHFSSIGVRPVRPWNGHWRWSGKKQRHSPSRMPDETSCNGTVRLSRLSHSFHATGPGAAVMAKSASRAQTDEPRPAVVRWTLPARSEGLHRCPRRPRAVTGDLLPANVCERVPPMRSPVRDRHPPTGLSADRACQRRARKDGLPR